MSSNDFKLYLTTYNTTKTYLEIDGVNIDTFKSYIKRSRAERKIVILDCCHSGAFIDQAMSTMASKIQADINEFTGTYIMTSAAGDELSLFPVKSPDKPTYFTGKFIEVLNEGLDNNSQFCSLRDIYDKIEDDFKYEGLPHPQQSNVNDADQLLFAINKKYRAKKLADEIAWEQALAENTKWAYIDFRKQFPESAFFRPAMLKIFELEDEESWKKTLERGTLSAFSVYIDNFPQGRYTEEANQKIAELRQSELLQYEGHFWNRVLNKSDLASLQSYLDKYPKGRYVQQCNEEILKLKEREPVQPFEGNTLQRYKEEQETQKKEEEIKTQVLQREKESEKDRESKRLREQEMLAYEKKEKELAAKRIEAERIKELELKRKEAERIKELQLEAERIESLRRKEEQQEAKKEAERKKLHELEIARKEQQRKNEEEFERKKNEERIKKEREQAEQKIKELAAKKLNEKGQHTQGLLHSNESNEFKISEEDYKEKVNNPKEVIILVGTIILVVSILLYIIFNNI